MRLHYGFCSSGFDGVGLSGDDLLPLPRPALAAARSRVSPLSIPEIFPELDRSSGLPARPLNRSATASAIATVEGWLQELESPQTVGIRRTRPTAGASVGSGFQPGGCMNGISAFAAFTRTLKGAAVWLTSAKSHFSGQSVMGRSSIRRGLLRLPTGLPAPFLRPPCPAIC